MNAPKRDHEITAVGTLSSVTFMFVWPVSSYISCFFCGAYKQACTVYTFNTLSPTVCMSIVRRIFPRAPQGQIVCISMYNRNYSLVNEKRRI